MKLFNLCYLLFLVAAIIWVPPFCLDQTDGFTVARIHSDLPYDPSWDVAPLKANEKEHLHHVLSQPFHYLGCGGQCFAFASADDRYVIKFFKHRFRKPCTLLLTQSLPEPFETTRLRKLNKASTKLKRDFTSYKIAYEELKEETGLVYIHLNKSRDLKETITITDKLGIAHQLQLDSVEFVLQKKADLVHLHIEELMEKGELEKAKASLKSLMHLIISRCQKGIFDEDAKIHRNFGFIEDQAIFIDVGRFTRDPNRKDPQVYKADLAHITKGLKTWLNEHYPILVSSLDEPQ
jgi:hypothetical protein